MYFHQRRSHEEDGRAILRRQMKPFDTSGGFDSCELCRAGHSGALTYEGRDCQCETREEAPRLEARFGGLLHFCGCEFNVDGGPESTGQQFYAS